MSAGTISGRAIVYGAETVIGGAFREIVDPRALADCDLSDVPLLRDHDTARIVARTSSGSLRLTNTSHGLEYTAELADTTDGRDVFALVSRGDVKGNSFGMGGIRDEWYSDQADLPLRVITRIGKLWEISAVSLPAYPQTTVGTGAAVPARSAAKPRMGMPLGTASDIEWSAFARGASRSHPLNKPGVVPIFAPEFAPKTGTQLREVRSMTDDEWALANGTQSRLSEIRPAASFVDVMHALDPAGPWGAYRSLAESRGVPAAHVAEMAARGRLGEVIDMPDVTGPAD